MLAWMGGKRSKLKHAKRQECRSRRTPVSLNDRQGGRTVEPPKLSKTIKKGQSKQKTLAAATFEGSRVTQLGPARLSSSGRAENEELDLKANSAQSMLPESLPDSKLASDALAHSWEGSEGLEASSVHSQPGPPKGSKCNKQRPHQAAGSLDLQAIQLPN